MYPNPHSAPYGAPPTVATVDGRELRPKARWFWFGGLTIPLSIALAIGVFASIFFTAVRLPEFAAEVDGGGTMSFEVAEGEEDAWGLYVSHSTTGDACEVTSAPYAFAEWDQLITPVDNEYRVSSGDSGWSLYGEIDTREPGEYVVECGVTGASAEDRYAVADLEHGTSFGGKLVLAFGSFLGIGLLGFVGGLVIIIVTAVRRADHRSRLIRERWGPAPRPRA
ncbi:hypothetical protein [Nocardiopsis lucentensis]|uniref:hypothetical protein n=1 Tax=Nocardiopsis lucentensis TaxID=53441 RepID=UPI0003492577|nr:hypothetical protein [Nocardiopsis lucentensis]